MKLALVPPSYPDIQMDDNLAEKLERIIVAQFLSLTEDGSGPGLSKITFRGPSPGLQRNFTNLNRREVNIAKELITGHCGLIKVSRRWSERSMYCLNKVAKWLYNLARR